MSGASPHELRRAPRKRADFNVGVTDAISGRSLGQLGNLSSSGLMLIGSQPPRSAAIYQVRIALPDGGKAAQSIDLGLQEQWHAPAASPSQIQAGYRIIAISDADHAALDAWLQRAD